MTRPSLLTMALPVTPISLLRFRKTSSIVPPHAPLVLFQQARVLTRKGGLSVSLSIVETMKCKSIVEKLRIRIPCLLYTSDAADDLLCVDLGGRRIIKKKNNIFINNTSTQTR